MQLELVVPYLYTDMGSVLCKTQLHNKVPVHWLACKMDLGRQLRLNGIHKLVSCRERTL